MVQDTSPVLCIDLPSRPPAVLKHSRYAITKPIITIENLDDGSYISAIFQLDLSSIQKDTWHEFLFRSVELVYSHELGEDYDMEPKTSNTSAWTVTDSRSRTFGLRVTAGGPPPVASVAPSLSWDKTITLQRTSDVWTVGATPTSETSYTWRWRSSLPDDGSLFPNPFPPELQNCMSWCVEVRRRVTDKDIKPVLDRSFDFKIKIEMYRKGGRIAACLRKFFTGNYFHRCEPKEGNFTIGSSEGTKLSTFNSITIPPGKTISVPSALARILMTPTAGTQDVTIPLQFPDNPTEHPGPFFAAISQPDGPVEAHAPMISVADLSKSTGL